MYFIALQLYSVFNIDDKHWLIGMVIPDISSTLQDELTDENFLKQASLGYFRNVSERFN
jgi:hypothetical protein